MANSTDRRRLPGNQNVLPPTFSTAQPDARDAARFGYTNLVRGMGGAIISGTDASGRQVPFVNGMAPERVTLNQTQAGGAGGTSGTVAPPAASRDPDLVTGGGLEPSTARRALDQAPTARQALDNVPPPNSSAAAPARTAATSPAPSAGPSAANVAQPTRAGGSPTNATGALAPMMAPLPPDALAALEQARSFHGTAFAGLAPSTAPATPPSIADTYRSGSNFNTASARKDFDAGKINVNQLQSVYDAATNALNTQATRPLSATDAANAAAERAHPSPSYGLVAEAPAPNGGQAVTLPSVQPQTAPANGASGIAVNGTPMNKNASGAFVAGAPSATPGTSTASAGATAGASGSTPMGYLEQQVAARAAYPQLGVAGSPQHQQFLDAFNKGGQNQSNVLALAHSLFGGNAAGGSAAPAISTPADVKETPYPTPLLNQVASQSAPPQLNASIPAPGGPMGLPTDKMDAAGISDAASTTEAQAEAAAPGATLKTGVPQPTGTGFPAFDQTVNRATAGIARLGTTIGAGDIQRSLAPNNPAAASLLAARARSGSFDDAGVNSNTPFAPAPQSDASAPAGMPGNRNLFASSGPGASAASSPASTPASTKAFDSDPDGGLHGGAMAPTGASAVLAGAPSAAQVLNPSPALAAQPSPAVASGPTNPLVAAFDSKPLTLNNTVPASAASTSDSGAPSTAVNTAAAPTPTRPVDTDPNGGLHGGAMSPTGASAALASAPSAAQTLNPANVSTPKAAGSGLPSDPSNPLVAEFGSKPLTLGNTAPGASAGESGNAYAGLTPNQDDPDELRRKAMAANAGKGGS